MSALAYYVAIGIVLHFTHGSYDPTGLFVIFLGWVAVVCFGPAGFDSRRAPGASLIEICLWAAVVFFGYKLLRNDMVHVIDSKHSQRVMKAFLWGSFALSCAGLISTFRPQFRFKARFKFRFQATLCVVIGACLFAAKIFAIRTSLHPTIDVFTISSSGADYLLRGINPYAQAYADIYHGSYGYVPTYCYWPGVLIPESLCKWIFGDVRYALILAEAVTAIGLGLIARFLQWPKRMSFLLPLLWLSFPVTLFVLDQAWVDTLLVASATLFTLFILREKWIPAGISLGIFCATKQYSVFFGFLSLVLLLTPWARSKKAFLKTAIASVLSFLALMLPFIFWDWRAFYNGTVAEFLIMPARADALSVVAALKHGLGWMPPEIWPQSWPVKWSIAIYLAALAAASWILYRSRESLENSMGRWSAGLVLVYGATFLFGKQAFCNYYDLLAYFVLLQFLFSINMPTSLEAVPQ